MDSSLPSVFLKVESHIMRAHKTKMKMYSDLTLKKFYGGIWIQRSLDSIECLQSYKSMKWSRGAVIKQLWNASFFLKIFTPKCSESESLFKVGSQPHAAQNLLHFYFAGFLLPDFFLLNLLLLACILLPP